MAPAPVVLIIGCGISGPVLGILLKRKGYHPIVFEKVGQMGDAGASLMLMSNGLKVLRLLGLSQDVLVQTKAVNALHDLTAQGETLGISTLPSTFSTTYGEPTAGIKRTSLNLMLKDALGQIDVEVREGWELLHVEEDDATVTAHFNGDRHVQGSFLVGCDGIKSATRRSILHNHGIAEGPPVYTGLTQTAGISEASPTLTNAAEMRNWYGDGVHMIAYPVSSTLISWAITRREGQEIGETWRPAVGGEAVRQKKILSELLSTWESTPLQLIQNAERIIKYGLFDREELPAEHWYSRRCVLIGDAAHPTSPHLGQGANQALEDTFHLSQILPSLCAVDDSSESNKGIIGSRLAEKIFKPFADKRQPRTSALVKRARVQGDKRVVAGRDACLERDRDTHSTFQDQSAMAERYDALLREPFQFPA